MQRFDEFRAGTDEIDPEGRLNRSHALLLSVDVGIRERLSAGALLPLRTTRLRGPETLDVEGLGDLDLYARWIATKPPHLPGEFRMTVLGGLSLPTGKEPTGAGVEENVRFGAGTTSFLLALELLGSAGPASLYGRAELRAPLGTSDAGFRYGETWTGVGGTDFALGSRGGILAQAIVQHQRPDRENGLVLPSRGGTWGYVAAGGRLRLGARGSGAILIQRLVYANVHGDQLVSPWTLIVSASLAR